MSRYPARAAGHRRPRVLRRARRRCTGGSPPARSSSGGAAAPQRGLLPLAGPAPAATPSSSSTTTCASRWSSPALRRVPRAGRRRLVGRSLLDVVHPEDVPPGRGPADAGRRATADAPCAEVAGLLLLRLQDEAGSWRYLEAGVTDLRGDADVGAVVLHCRDMTDRHAREQALQSVAYTDPMTGLPNRAGFLRPCSSSWTGGDPATPSHAADDRAGRPRRRPGERRPRGRPRRGGRGRPPAACHRARRGRRRPHGRWRLRRPRPRRRRATPTAWPPAACPSWSSPSSPPTGVIDLTAGVGLVPLEGGLSVEELLDRGRPRRPRRPRGRPRHRRGGTTRRSATPPPGGTGCAPTSRARAPATSCPALPADRVARRSSGSPASRRSCAGGTPSWARSRRRSSSPLAERAGLIGELMRWAVEETHRRRGASPSARTRCASA